MSHSILKCCVCGKEILPGAEVMEVTQGVVGARGGLSTGTTWGRSHKDCFKPLAGRPADVMTILKQKETAARKAIKARNAAPAV